MDLPRRRRLRLPGDVYGEPGRAFSITIATAPRRPIFADVEFGKECFEILKARCEQTATRCYAYCLMPDHVHLLLGAGPETPIPTFVGSWKSLCSVAHRHRVGTGRFWQRSFFDRALRDNENLENAARYILANPVRAGLARAFRDYQLCGSFEFEP